MVYEVKFYDVDLDIFGQKSENLVYTVTLYGYGENASKNELLEHALHIAAENNKYDDVVNCKYRIYAITTTLIYE